MSDHLLASASFASPATPQRRPLNLVLWLVVIAAGLVQLAMIYHIGWVRGWRNPEAAETYEPLIPLGALALAWVRRERLIEAARPLTLTPEQQEERAERMSLGLPDPLRHDAPASLWWPTVGCALLLLNHLWRYQELSVIALVVLLLGSASALYGARMVRALRAPLAFLVLMAPLPHLLTSRTAQMLQINSTALTGDVLQGLHIGVRVIGNTLLFARYRLQVSEACGGLGILVQMQVLTLFLLLLRPTRMFQRVTLLALVTLLTPFANVMRLVTMGLLAQVRPEWATRLHDTNSWAFTLLLFGLMCWLAHRLGIVGSEGATANESEGHTKDEGQGLAHPSSFIPHPWSPRAGWGEVRRLAGLGLLLLLTCVLGFEIDARVGKGGEWLPQVPASFSGWQGREHAMEWTFVDEERYLSRVYTNGFGEAVQAFVIAPRSGYGYRDPRGCLRGSGYFVTAERLVDLGEGGEGRELVLCNDAGAQMVMCYWQQGRGGWVRAEAPVFAYHSGTQALTELRMVGEALLHPKPSCLVRVYAPFGTEDPQGRQAQRNVLAVSREVYRSIRPQGR